MANITVLVPQNAKDFCELYRKLQKLLGKKNLRPQRKEWVAEAIDSLMFYVVKAGESVVASFNLSKAVKESKLPDLELYHHPGNIYASKILDALQMRFPLSEGLENDEDLISKSLISSRFSQKSFPVKQRSGSKKKKVKPREPITTSQS